MELMSYEAIFGINSHDKPAEVHEQVMRIPLDKIRDKVGHSFSVKDDIKMAELVESVKRAGVLEPCIVYELPDGSYEMNAGHRRKRASELAGLTDLPVIIRKKQQDDRDIEEVDTNINRGEPSPMEKARAYKKRMEALKEDRAKTRQNGGAGIQQDKGKRSDQILAEQLEKSRNQINRYIRLNELIEPLQELAAQKKLPLVPAVELSYLQKDEQELLYTYMGSCVPSEAQAKKLREYSKKKELNKAVIELVLQEKEKGVRVTLNNDTLRQYFPEDYAPNDMTKIIINLLEGWKKEQKLT